VFALALVASALLGALEARGQLSAPSFSDVPYYPGGSCAVPLSCSDAESEQCLDVYLPASRSTGRPTVLVIHGGGWTGGSKNAPEYLAFCARLSALGYPVVSCNYTLACPDRPSYPQPIRDVRAALAWVRGPGQRPPYSLGPCVVAVGFSAGAHLAAMLGVLGDESEPSFLPVGAYPPAVPGRGLAPELVIAVSGPLDLYRFGREGAMAPAGSCPCFVGFLPGYPQSIIGFATETFLGCTWTAGCNALPCAPQSVRPDDPCLQPNQLTGNPFVDASPVHWISPADPPFFLLYTRCDPIVPGAASRWMKTALESAGVPVQERDLGYCGHAFTLFDDGRQAADAVEEALRSVPVVPCR